MIITKKILENWIGSDNMDADSFLDLLIDLLSGEYAIEDMKEEIINSCPTAPVAPIIAIFI